MALSEKAQQELGALAQKRVDAAMSSVAQLLEDDEQLLKLALFVLSSLARSTAIHMMQTVRKDDGSELCAGEALSQTLAAVAKINGLESKVLTEAEAIKFGLEKPDGEEAPTEPRH
jgi:hypothetical protein